MLLYGAVGLLERVRVVSEGDQHRDIDREALHLLEDVERRAGGGGVAPSPFQALRYRGDVRIEFLEVPLRQRGDGKFALRTPSLALGVEDALDSRLRHHRIGARRAPERLWPRAMDLFQHGRV